MRILYIANARLPTEKAHGWQIIKMNEAFGRLGHEVTLLLPRRRNPIKEDIFSFYGLNSTGRVKYIPNFFFFLEKILPGLYFWQQRIFFLLGAFMFGLFWHGVIFSREIAVCYLLSLFGKQVVLEDHEPRRRFFSLYALMLRRIKKKILVAKNLESVYKICGVKQQSYIVVPNGVDLGDFIKTERDASLWQRNFGISSGRKIALYVGHFYKWKGIYALIDAAAKINCEVVLIGGTQTDQEEIKKYISNSKSGNAGNLHLHAFMSHAEIIKCLKSANVLILPNTAAEERSNKYTTPIKMFEYMAAGVPIVASDLPSFNEYLVDKENCFLFKPDDSISLAKVVNFALENPEVSGNLAKKALSDVQKYTWVNRASKIVEFININ